MSHTPDPNSTFTTNYEFEKAPIDSFEDTWADLINDNLDLIDTAIAGAPVVPVGGTNRTTTAVANKKIVMAVGGGMWGIADHQDPGILTAALAITLSTTTSGGQEVELQAIGPVAIPGFSDSNIGARVYVGAGGDIWSFPGQYDRVAGMNCGDGTILLNHTPYPYTLPHQASHATVGGDSLAPSDIGALAVPTFASVSSDTTLSGASPRIVLVDTTAEDIAITLPAADICAGQTFTLKKTAPSATTYGAKFARAGSDTIDGGTETTPITAQYGTVRIVSDGSDWWIV